MTEKSLQIIEKPVRETAVSKETGESINVPINTRKTTSDGIFECEQQSKQSLQVAKKNK